MKFSHSEINDVTGNRENWYWDADNQKWHIQTIHHVGDVLEMNKRQQVASLDQRFGNQMMHHVAEIPNGVIIKLKREHGVDVFSNDPEQQKKLRKLLDDPEFRYLKSTTKRLWRP